MESGVHAPQFIFIFYISTSVIGREPDSSSNSASNELCDIGPLMSPVVWQPETANDNSLPIPLSFPGLACEVLASYHVPCYEVSRILKPLFCVWPHGSGQCLVPYPMAAR